MTRSTELATPAAAAVVVLTTLLGGGFYPLPRMVVGVALLTVWALAAVGTSGRLDRTEWLLFGVVAWGLVSAVMVGSSPLAAKETLTIWIIALLLFGIGRRGNEESRRQALGVLTVGAAVVATGVVVEALRHGLRVGGLLENPNVAVALLAPMLPVGWRVLDRWPRWRWAWSMLVVVGIVCTGSRAGLLAAVVAFGILLPRGRIRLAGIAVGSLMATSVLVWRFVSQPDVLAWHRISIWWAVIKIWATRPLTGVGPGSLLEAAGLERILHPDQVGRYQFVINYSESTPLAILVQVGLVGLVLAAIACCWWWLDSRRSGTLDSESVRASLGAMGVLALFHDFLTIDPVLWWWVVVVGCLDGWAFRRKNSPPVSAPSASRIVVGSAVIWLTCWGMIEPALARHRWRSGSHSEEDAARALRAEPWYSEPAGSRVRILLDDPNPWTWTIAAEALHWGNYARTVQPGLARRWADLGRVHLRILTDLGGTDENIVSARRCLDRACELDPHLPWPWLEQARLARISGNYELAVKHTRHALEQEPNTIRGWLFLSRLELERGRMGAARDALTEAERRSRLDRSNLNDYELELVLVPPKQLESIQRALATGESP